MCICIYENATFIERELHNQNVSDFLKGKNCHNVAGSNLGHDTLGMDREPVDQTSHYR